MQVSGLLFVHPCDDMSPRYTWWRRASVPSTVISSHSIVVGDIILEPFIGIMVYLLTLRGNERPLFTTMNGPSILREEESLSGNNCQVVRVIAVFQFRDQEGKLEIESA